jgi:ubiquinone biosynthesis protein UbiJ
VSLSDLAFAGLEQAINRYVALDPDAKQGLAGDHGRVIRLQLLGSALDLFFIPRQDGRLQLLRRIEGEPDCTLAGSPIDLLRSGDSREGARQLFSGRVRLSGDTELAQRFGAALAGLDIDWEEQLSKLTGDVIAHQLGRQLRRGRDYSRTLGRTIELDLGEYLSEELRVLPSRNEAEAQFAEIERLRDGIERAAARLERLQRRLGGEDRR